MRKTIIIFMILLFSVSIVYADDERSLLDLIQEVLDESTENTETLPGDGSITVMIYMCGSTLEEYSQSATRDILEIIGSEFDSEKVKVVLMAGGSKKWANNMIPDGTTGIYYVTRNNFLAFNDGNSYNMGDPATLSFFLTEVYENENCQTDRYALILWDHGGGSINGICQDEIFDGDSLSMEELATALNQSPFAKRKLDWIGFDACLMGSAETAKILAPYADYMIASEGSEPTEGWNYSFLKDLEKDKTSKETCERIINAYTSFLNQKYPQKIDANMSCVDLNKISNLVWYLNNFIADIEITNENYAALSRARRSVIGLGRDADSLKDPDLVDLGHLVEKLSEFGDAEKAEKLLNSLSETVPICEPGEFELTGISVYFPFNNKFAYPKFMSIYTTLGFSPEYEGFITTFGKYLFSSGSNSWSRLSTVRDSDNKSIRSRFKIELTEEQAGEFCAASLIALQKPAEDDAWQLVSIQDAYIENRYSLTGEYKHQNLFFVDPFGEPLHDTAIIYEDLGDQLIRFPVVLVDEQNKETDAVMVCTGNPERGIIYNPADQRESAGSGNIIFYLYDEAIDGYSPRLTADPSKFSYVKYLVSEREMTFENDILLPFDQWKVIDTVSYDLPLDDVWSLKLIDGHLDTDSLYIAFQITDIYNNVIMSMPTKLIRGADPDIDLETIYEDLGLIVIDNEKFAAEENRLSVRITNISDSETVIFADSFIVNDTAVDLERQGVYGNGPIWGLLPGESQILSVKLLPDAEEYITKISYDLTLYGAEDELIGATTVTHLIHN